jgi:amidase
LLNPALNVVVIRWFDEARDAAPHLPDGPFHGVPFLPWTQAHFADAIDQWVPAPSKRPISPTDTTLVSRFRQAGLNIAGRTNSPEFGSLPTTEPIAWGATHNPWSLEHSPGGSSGGSAAAVSSGMVPFAHASDGGGSIRIPASCCGLKPSQGRITLGPFRDESNSE